MRTLVIGLGILPAVFALTASACSGTSKSGFGGGGSNGSGSGTGGTSGSSAGTSGSGGIAGSGGSAGAGGSSGIGLGDGGGGGKDVVADVIVMSKTTIYANTDTQLYTVDPSASPPAVTVVGTFSGTSGTTYDGTVTDVAVDAEGDVYVNTESVVYKVSLPSCALTKVATITPPAGVKYIDMYALAFAPKGFLGSGEALIGGDGNGEVWAIDTTTGATQDLGNFGGVPGTTDGSIFGLSGDIVFYTDASGTPTGLATIRECKAGGTSCTSTNDYLVGINMTNLKAAYTSGKGPSLLGGIYGGSSTSIGPGTGYGRLFGLGAWEGNVYGFERAETMPASPPDLVQVNTTTGAGTVVGSSFGFTSGGWSGAGVSTTVTITVPMPPPPPPQPK